MRFSQSVVKTRMYDEYSRDEVVRAGGLVLERLLTSTEVEHEAAGRRSSQRPVDSSPLHSKRRAASFSTSAFPCCSAQPAAVAFSPLSQSRGASAASPSAYGRALEAMSVGLRTPCA